MRRRVAAQCAALLAVALVATTTFLSASPAEAAETRSYYQWPAPGEPTPTPSATPTPSPTPSPTPAPPTPEPAPPVPSVNGTASNYPGTAGYGGQAVVALPGALGGRYTGAIGGYVTVCADRCVRLPAVDGCQCYWGSGQQRVIDLSHEAWAMVSDQPLSRGLINVRLVFDDPALVARM